MQGENYVAYDSDPHLINVQQERKRLERQVDDIIWEDGVNDPRLGQLITELHHLRKLEEEGVLYEPNF
jgi:hypothetical protein